MLWRCIPKQFAYILLHTRYVKMKHKVFLVLFWLYFMFQITTLVLYFLLGFRIFKINNHVILYFLFWEFRNLIVGNENSSHWYLLLSLIPPFTRYLATKTILYQKSPIVGTIVSVFIVLVPRGLLWKVHLTFLLVAKLPIHVISVWLIFNLSWWFTRYFYVLVLSNVFLEVIYHSSNLEVAIM